MYHSVGIVMSASIFVALTTVVAAPGETKRPIVVTGPSSDVITREVSYRDLNLASRSGERTFMHRVAGTINEVCNDLSPTARVHTQTICRSEAWRSVRPQIGRAVRRSAQFAGADRSLVAAGATITLTFAR